jgi:uncharacterized protein (TIGR02172 family)
MSTPASPAQTPHGVALVGKGSRSDVYAWGEGRILKLLHSWVPANRAEREYRATRAVHAAGLPAPAAYELVEVEGRRGIVFERVEGISMLKFVQARPWTLFSAARQLAELHAQMHRRVAPVELPSQREWIARGIDEAGDLSATDKQAARSRLKDLPDGTALCHGDLHPENILFTERGPVVIDWGTATRGHPHGDVACTLRLMRNAGLPPWAPVYVHLLLKCSRGLLYRSYLGRYFQLHAGTPHEIEAWRVPLAAARPGVVWKRT